MPSINLVGFISTSATITFIAFNFIVMNAAFVPSTYRYLFVTPTVTFQNMMACRVFRGVALGMMNDSASMNFGLTSTRIAAAFDGPSDPLPPGCSKNSSMTARPSPSSLMSG